MTLILMVNWIPSFLGSFHFLKCFYILYNSLFSSGFHITLRSSRPESDSTGCGARA